MEITGSRTDSSLGNLSGKLTDILVHSTVGVIHIDVDCNVFEAAKKMRDHKVGALMVVEKDTLSGIFTERDLMIRVIAEGHDPKKVKVSEYMTSSVATASPETPISEAANLMSQNRIRHLPVIHDGKLFGLVSTGDILAWKLSDQEITSRHLENYIFNS
ncbi:MAG: CBS domain-containing protein [bacterium]